MKRLIFIVFNLFFYFHINAQTSDFSLGAWHHQSMNGRFSLEGFYRSQETILKSDFTERPKVTDLFGKLDISSKSYIWHPNFLELHLKAKYNPGTRREKFLVMPNRSETKTAESFHLQTHFFDQRPFNFTLFSNLDHAFLNREYTSNVELMKKEFGSHLSFINSKLPVSLNYLKSDWEQKETQSNRVFENNRHSLRTVSDKSFGKNSQHSLEYTYDNYTRTYANNASVNNISTHINLKDRFSFGKKQRNRFHSRIHYFDQHGSNDYNRLQVQENLALRLPQNLKYESKYHFTRYEYETDQTRQHNVVNTLEHQLYASLTSRLFHEFYTLNREAFTEKKYTSGLNLDYTKTIPYGNLSLNYQYRQRNEERDSRGIVLTIINEEQQLDDDRTTLLDQPFIDSESIVVTDESGAIVYTEGIDYILIIRGDYIEIQRIPGGQISNGAMVYLDYRVFRQTSYDFHMASNHLNMRFNFMKNFLQIYFRFLGQDYYDISFVENLNLRTIYQHVYGIRISKNSVSCGFELDDFNSNLIPYQSKRYYISVHGNFFTRLSVSVTGNHRDYQYIWDNEEQKYSNIAGRINYRKNKNAVLMAEGGYRLQDGRGFDLKLATLKGEFSYRWRQTFYTLGLELYRRDFSGEIINYNGFYFRFDRNF